MCVLIFKQIPLDLFDIELKFDLKFIIQISIIYMLRLQNTRETKLFNEEPQFFSGFHKWFLFPIVKLLYK